VSAAIEALRPELFHALLDRDPRVRQEALGALRRGSVPGAAVPAKTLLKSDAWTYVRVAAAELLGDVGSAGGGPDIDVSLADATKDAARSVRIAALAALAHRNARAQVAFVRARAFDEDESVEVRREAVAALGALCDAASADELFELAKRTGESDAARNLALTAIVALGAIHPPDLAARLKALDASELVVKDAIARALKTPSVCAASP
jgi:HEAT repeat protein